MLEEAARNMMLCGDSTVVMGWWIESHTLGCRNAADEPEEDWWTSHWAIFEEYEANPKARILFDRDSGAFVTLTPQRGTHLGATELIELGAKARKRTPLARAEEIADGIVRELKPLSEVVLVAGSIRRRKPEIGDIDLIVLPKDVDAFLEYLDENDWSGGERKRVKRVSGINAEVHIAHRPEELGGHLFMYTGDQLFEIAMRSKAKRLGWRLNQYGIFDAKTGDVIVESPDERDFFDSLGVAYHTPEERSLKDRPRKKKASMGWDGEDV